MLYKVIEPSADYFGEPVFSQVKLSSRGLRGHDLNQFLKRASHEFVDFLQHAQFEPGEIPVHLLAIGSTEKYGCFAAGTPIAMANGQYRPIENVAIGDPVLSADGHICPVTWTFRRTVASGTRLDVSGLPFELLSSDDHPYRVAKKEQFTCCHDKYKRCLPPLQGNQNICNRIKHVRACVAAEFPEIVSDWTVASEIQPGDFLVWTAPDLEPEFEPSVAECYMIGAWLAEGCYQNLQALRFACGKSEKEFEFASKIQQAAISNGFSGNLYDQTEERSTYVVTAARNIPRVKQYIEAFGNLSTGKHVAPWLCCLPREQRLALVAGYIDGDGHNAVSAKENRATARTVSFDLACGIQRIIWSLGCPATVCTVTNGGKDKLGYNVSFPHAQLEELSEYSIYWRSRPLLQTSKVHGFYHEGRMYLPVRNVGKQLEPFDVFNFEVDGDHTYSGPNVDSHNCNRNGDGFREKICREFHPTFVKHAKWYRYHQNKNPRKSFGIVKASAYNDPMSRIELLVLLNGNRQIAEKTGGLVADQEQEKLARGEDIPVSMACYVSHDVCSGCGNKARTRADYCDERKCVKYGGCQKNLGRTFDDGHQLHVDNPDPRFFDISGVTKPADRIAYTLYKAAHEQHLKSGAELAEELAVTAPLDVLRDASNLPHLLISQLEVLDQLTAVEKQASALHTPLDPLFFTTTYPVPSLRHYKLAHVLQALADVQAVMPLAQFLSLTAGGAVDAAALEKVASRVPGVFNRLASEPALENILQENTYLPSGEAPYREVRDWAMKVAEDWSVAPERISHRLLRGATAEASHRLRVAPIGEPQTLSEKRAEDLAREYALYQLGFLHAQRNHPQFAAISQLTLRGNQLTW